MPRDYSRPFYRLASVILTGLAAFSCAVQDDITNTDSGDARAISQPAVDTKSSDVTRPPPPEAKKKTWNPPPPASDDYDWIRMKSGEWLKGEIKVMREGELEFDSDEFDLQQIDWDDVAELRSPRKTNTILYDDKAVAVGTLLIQDDTVVVGTEDGQQLQLERERLRTIIPAETTGWGFWSGKLSLGFTARSGNSDQVDLSTYAFLRRRSPRTRFTVQYDGSFSRVEEVETVNSQRASGQFDYFLTHRLFLTPFLIEYFRDPFQNIENQITPGAGLGYTILDEGDLQWEVGAAGAYRFTRFESVQAGEDEQTENAIVILGTKFETDITDDVEFVLEYSLQIGVSDVEESSMHTRLAFEVELTSILDLDVGFVWDRTGNPRRSSDGVIPDEDDFRTTVGLGLDF